MPEGLDSLVGASVGVVVGVGWAVGSGVGDSVGVRVVIDSGGVGVGEIWSSTETVVGFALGVGVAVGCRVSVG